METTFKTLTKIIKEHDKILIMAHKNSDLDAFGSMIAMHSIISDFKKDVSVCINKKELNLSVKKAYKLIEDENINFVYKTKIDEHNYDLLIILDTAKKELLEIPSIIDKIKDIVVIDHHIVTNKNIDNTKMSYVNASISSTNEFMASYLRYLNKTVSINTATIMHAGLEVDTNFYRSKTSESTFLAAAILSSMGSDSSVKQELLKEDKNDYFRRVDYIKKSFIVKDYAICIIEDESQKEELSMISEKLLTFDGVTAAFTIAKTYDKMVSISARSLGGVDVFKIMKKFDGGGHLTEAAAQVSTENIKDVLNKLSDILEVKI